VSEDASEAVKFSAMVALLLGLTFFGFYYDSGWAFVGAFIVFLSIFG